MDDEVGLDSAALLAASLSTSPLSSGVASSISEECTLLNIDVKINLFLEFFFFKSFLFPIIFQRAKFELPVPQSVPQDLNTQFICETASRLLFLSIHWIKSIRAIASK